MPSKSILIHLPNDSTEDVGSVHLLPCTIKHNGPAPVSTYFIPRSDEEGNHISNFHGRLLQGTDYTLPKNVKGVVFSEAAKDKSAPPSKIRKKNVQNDGAPEASRVWHGNQTFSKIMAWKHDHPASQSDLVPRAFEWINIASAIHE